MSSHPEFVRPLTVEDLVQACQQKVDDPDSIEIIVGSEVMLDLGRRLLALE
jgi:hypothetical protein